MSKINRTLASIKESQYKTENEVVKKFADVEQMLEVKHKSNKRISPQLSCTILAEDKELLYKLALYLSNKKGKIVNISVLIRLLIHLGYKYKEEISL